MESESLVTRVTAFFKLIGSNREFTTEELEIMNRIYAACKPTDIDVYYVNIPVKSPSIGVTIKYYNPVHGTLKHMLPL